MTRLFLLFLLVVAPVPAWSDAVLAARTIPARTILTELDLVLSAGEAPGALSALEQAVGLETRAPIYAGRPVVQAVLGPPAVIERNAIVILRYVTGALLIETEGRALDRAAAGERARVMNISSRLVVTGFAISPGIVEVGR